MTQTAEAAPRFDIPPFTKPNIPLKELLIICGGISVVGGIVTGVIDIPGFDEGAELPAGLSKPEGFSIQEAELIVLHNDLPDDVKDIIRDSLDDRGFFDEIAGQDVEIIGVSSPDILDQIEEIGSALGADGTKDEVEQLLQEPEYELISEEAKEKYLEASEYFKRHENAVIVDPFDANSIIEFYGGAASSHGTIN